MYTFLIILRNKTFFLSHYFLSETKHKDNKKLKSVLMTVYAFYHYFDLYIIKIFKRILAMFKSVVSHTKIFFFPK